MSRPIVSFPEFLFAAGTRALGGIGIGLLLAEHLNSRRRRTFGLGLLAIGALTTIPLARRILPRVRDRSAAASELPPVTEADVG